MHRIIIIENSYLFHKAGMSFIVHTRSPEHNGPIYVTVCVCVHFCPKLDRDVITFRRAAAVAGALPCVCVRACVLCVYVAW